MRTSTTWARNTATGCSGRDERTWHLPFRWDSDPDRRAVGQAAGAGSAAERGGLFHPLVLLVAPDGRVVVEHRSRDFADRPSDDDVLEGLRGLGLPPRSVPPPWRPDLEPQPTENEFRAEAYGPYVRGIRFAMRALVGRMHDEHDATELQQTQQMAASFLEAWAARRAA